MGDKIKEKLTEWIAILVTFIIGICSLFMSYQAIQSQRELTSVQISNQEQLAQFQADLQRKNIFAHLKLAEGDFSFTITNDGPNIANNVNIWVTLIGIEPIWNIVVKNINSFKLIYSEPALVSSINTTNHAINSSQKIDGNNSYQINIAALAPGEELDTDINLNDSILTEDHRIDKLMNIYFANSTLSDYSEATINTEASVYLNNFGYENYQIASFDISLGCNNCEEDIYHSSGTIISLSYLGISDTKPSYVKSYRKYHQWTGMVQIEYYLPKGAIHLPIDFPQNLQITQNSADQSGNFVDECVPSECTQF